MRISTDFKIYNFWCVVYIKGPQTLHTQFSKNSHIHKCMCVHTHKCMCVHTHAIFPMCVITKQMKTEHFLHATHLHHALSQSWWNWLKMFTNSMIVSPPFKRWSPITPLLSVGCPYWLPSNNKNVYKSLPPD